MFYETHYDELQPYFGETNIQKPYIDTDAFVLNIISKDFITDLKILGYLFDFNTLSENHELFNDVNKKVFGKIKEETPKTSWIDESICLRIKMDAIKSGNNRKKGLK